jgi:hypothetical protein
MRISLASYKITSVFFPVPSGISAPSDAGASFFLFSIPVPAADAVATFSIAALLRTRRLSVSRERARVRFQRKNPCVYIVRMPTKGYRIAIGTIIGSESILEWAG